MKTIPTDAEQARPNLLVDQGRLLQTRVRVGLHIIPDLLQGGIVDYTGLERHQVVVLEHEPGMALVQQDEEILNQRGLLRPGKGR